MKLVSIAALLLGAVPVAVNAAAVGGTPNGAKIIPVSDAAGLRSVGAHSSKYPNRKTVTIRPSKNDYDDISSDFLWGIKQANHGGRLLLEKGKKYVIGKKLDLTFLDNIEVQLEGELKFTNNITYWQANNYYYDFQKSITFWRWGGNDIKIFGSGTLNGNGQAWYNAFAGLEILDSSNTFYRPILFLTDNATRVSVEGITQLNSPCWTNFFVNTKDISFDDVYIHAFSTNASALPKNTDGFDSYNVDGLTVTNTRVDIGDDCFSPKPNTTNIFVQNLWCNNTHGVSMGSIGQYPGELDIIENAWIENVTLLNGQNGARLKAWAGPDVGYGRINNITYKNIQIQNTDNPVVLDQCYFDINATECAQYPSSVNITNILFQNIWGTSSGKEGLVVADLTCSPAAVCTNVTLQDVSLTSPAGSPAEIICSGITGGIGVDCGSGKTTLLEHILQSPDHGLHIAVIVNDMSSLNIDATLIKHHTVSHTKESLIQLQNGCICCTLRGDLLSELARLTTQKEVEYVVIESTGISEPMQVAETFTAEFSTAMVQAEAEGGVLDEEGKKILDQINTLGGLHQLSTLDTTVTVIDAFNLLSNLDTTDFLSDRYGADTIIPEDERTISDLMVDQIEFADVILINKMDMLASRPHDRDRIMQLVTTLNPSAKVLQTSYSRVDVKEILGTGRFDFLKAASGAGWLRSLHEMSKLKMGNGEERWAPTPETLEYGINNFVYTARRPFHPRRLYNLLHDKFIILQNAADDAGADDEEEEEEEGDREEDATAVSDTEMHSESEEEEEEEEDPTQPTPQEILANKRAHPLLQPLLRSKGFFWLATRPYQFGEWSQAGAMLTLNCGGPWFAEVPDEAWPEDGDVRKSIEEDFQGEWGDRRQEIVFIGEGVDVDGVTGLLNECLLSTKEMKRWEKVMRDRKMERGGKQEVMARIWEDGWEEWPAVDEEDEDEEEDEDDENDDVEEKTEDGKKKRKISEFMHGGHAHHGHSHKHK
ncbi:putative extracellular exo-polygalacturonase [Aspergillus brunneoviolaceus CBS 621.78]|uniref:CobW domain protein n=1 Tax=Aspergillus brunneoviolaceus CBS 621.78 TaxID=1450534 RepID=A0ACD1G041_9EURO|nr:CobW domain protein [Aspergillus brunneoviolaceus CBS 621.78]RAH42595.1 CobW domain protein [Aspergillus brunneoviolaceus CBS 621.78]